MIRVDNLSANANQVCKVSLSDGSIVALTFTYNPATQRWALDVEKDKFAVYGLGVCVNPNLLRPWRDAQKFGVACVTGDAVDPVLVDDFSSGRAVIYILENDDIIAVERGVYA